MGSFDMTCAVSKFPIGYGDKVRYLWLTPHPYEDHLRLKPWVARTTALRGVYGDYGRPEEIKKTVAFRLWMESLKYDLIEVGVGDNSCHDVATSKDMTFEQAQEAVWEGRLLVQRNANYHRPLSEDEKAQYAARLAKMEEERKARGPSEQEKLRATVIPTLQTVITILKDAGFTVNNGSRGSGEGFLVDEVDYGFIRVRDCVSKFDRKGDYARLEKVRTLLAQYATMLAAGSGDYADDAEVLVLPKPGLDPVKQQGHQFEIHRHRKNEDRQSPLQVAQCFIREDVWQILLRRPFNESFEFGESDYEIDKLKEYALQLFEEHVSMSGYRFTQAFSRVSDDSGKKNPMRWAVRQEGSGLSAPTLWKMLADKVRHGEKVSDKQIIQFVHDFTEMYRVGITLQTLRQGWEPSTSMGPQHGELSDHRAFHRELARIGTKRGIKGSHKSEGRALTLKPPENPDDYKFEPLDDEDDSI